jgi:hypothetical protein
MHANTICELAILRHHELQAHAAQQRLAAQARAPHPRQPGTVTATRIRFGSMLIGIGRRVQGMTETGRSPVAFGSPESARVL